MKNYSIIICTYNRCELLGQTIESLLKVLDGRTDYEILVIDNNSKDATKNVTLSFNSEKVSYFLEVNQGLSFARNRGILESKGEILVFFDDDIDIVSNYFELCDDIFSDNSVSMVGGKVLPFNSKLPSWLPAKYDYLVSLLDLGNQRKVVDYAMGCNCIFRREVIQRVGDFDINLGRKGTNLMAGEENDYQDRAKALGYVIEYIPELIVYHKIEEKLTKEYVLKYAYLNGKSSSIMFSSNISGIKHGLRKLKSIIMIASYFVYGAIADALFKTLLFKIRFEYSKGYLHGK